jgi:hypothetical protein
MEWISEYVCGCVWIEKCVGLGEWRVDVCGGVVGSLKPLCGSVNTLYVCVCG